MFEGNAERMDQTNMVLAAYEDERELRDESMGMCVDKPAGEENITNMMVEAPTSPGIWRLAGPEINSHWELYLPDVAETIFSAFCDGRSFVEWVDGKGKYARKRRRDEDDRALSSFTTGSTHRVDFETMKEVELSSGVKIDISIVEASISSINYTPSAEPIETGVWWEADSGKLHSYPAKAVREIRKAWRRRDHFVTLKKIFTPKYPGGVKYIINLMEMEQLNPTSGRKRPIKIISNARMPQDVVPSGGGFNLTIFSLSTDLLRGSLQRLLSVGLMDSIVSKMVLAPHEILAIGPSKYLKDDDHHLVYRKFRLAYETLARCVPGCCGQLMRLRAHTRESDTDEGLPNLAASSETEPMFQHVLYLAPAAEVGKIMETGLQECRHTKECFAFSTDYYDSQLPHNWGQSPTYRLLVFLVVVPQSYKGTAGLANAIPVASVDHQLPVAVLSLRSHALTVEPEILGHDSVQSRATDSNPFDCAAHNESCLQQVFCSATAGRQSVAITTTAHSSPQQPILPSKSKGNMFLLFKLYCPQSERLQYVGGLDVQVGNRPVEILEWLREIAGLAPDAEIRLYTEDSSTCVDLNSTYAETELEDGSVVVYNAVLTGKERGTYRCPDLPTFREHVSNRQTVRFRSIWRPSVDVFSLELSHKETYSDVVEKVAQHVRLKDENRVVLYFNDCFLQLPKSLPMDVSCYSTTLGNAHKNTSSILYYKILESSPKDFDESKILTISFHGGKGEKISVHEVELPQRSTVKDVVEKLRGMVHELRNPADAQMRIFEVRCHRVSKIHPPNEKIAYLCPSEDWPSESSLRAVEILDEDKDVGPKDLLIHVRHFHCAKNSRKCDFFGDPFLMVVREWETLAQVKYRMKDRLQVPEEEFLQCKVVLLSGGRREYLNADDVVASRMKQFSLGFYDPIVHFLALEHGDSNKSWRHHEDVLDSTRRLKRRLKNADGSLDGKRASKYNMTVRQANPSFDNSEPNKGDRLQNQASRCDQAEPTGPLTTSRIDIKSSDQRGFQEEKLALTVVEPVPNQVSSKCNSPKPTSLAICKPFSSGVPPKTEISRITVTDPEFHNFDAARTEEDIFPDQVWAIYDNHDGMPRYYGLITAVSHSPFQVKLLWLEPPKKKRWWVEATGVSITCGEYEISQGPVMEEQIGVFSHLVLEKAAPVRGRIAVYPRKGEVWAIFKNWDFMHMLGPKPILTPNGAFNQYYEYHIVQMLDDYERGARAVRLIKTKGFKTIFHPQEGPHGIDTYTPDELKKFSHRIPAEKMDGCEISLLPGSLELDPASLPVEMTAVDGPLATGEVNFGPWSGTALAGTNDPICADSSFKIAALGTRCHPSSQGNLEIANNESCSTYESGFCKSKIEGPSQLVEQ